jgi:transposase
MLPLMRSSATGKRDFSALERRRMKAARFLERGLCPAQVARRVAGHRPSVCRWRQILEREGRAGLRQAGRAGRTPKLRADDRLRLEEELGRGPRAWGYRTELWTTQRVADLIQHLCGVRSHRDHVGRVLGQMGWSCQRPVGQAKERNQAALRRWKPGEWPRIKKKRKN